MNHIYSKDTPSQNIERQMALALICEPAKQRRKHPYDFGNNKHPIQLSYHQIITEAI